MDECGGPICDFCVFYAFNGDERGAYVDKGECLHPAHPGRREPFDACDDFECGLCKKDTA
jgi:hypothetical protein